MLERARSRAYDGLLKTNEPVNFKPIDVPHSHEEELRLDRLAREQREGGIVLQSNQMTPARPSTTLTETLAQAKQSGEDIMERMRKFQGKLQGEQNVADDMETMREMRGIDDEMARLMGRMNEPPGDDI